MMPFRLIPVLLVALGVGVAGCQPRAVPVTATPDYEASVRTILPPSPDRARFYIFLGKAPTGYRLHGISGDVFIDGTKIGSLNPNEAMVLDVVPGKHALYWQYLNPTGNPPLPSEPFETDFKGGSAYILFVNLGLASLEIATGTVRSRDNPQPAHNNIPNLFRIVRPSACPPAFCL